MNKQAVLNVAEEILLFDYIEKSSRIPPDYLRKNYKEINELFNKFIREQSFMDPKMRRKVPYLQLDPKFKVKVWDLFLKELDKKFKPQESIEELVNDTIKNFRVLPAASPA